MLGCWGVRPMPQIACKVVQSSVGVVYGYGVYGILRYHDAALESEYQHTPYNQLKSLVKYVPESV